MLKIHEAKNILEIACGTGELTLQLLPKLAPDTKYTSVDLSDTMIEAAKAKKAKMNLDKLEVDHKFMQANAQDLQNFENESFDLVIAPLVLHLVPEPEKMLSEVKRVLKKGGKFGCSVLGEVQNCTFFMVAKDIFEKHDLVNKQVRSIHYLGER